MSLGGILEKSGGFESVLKDITPAPTLAISNSSIIWSYDESVGEPRYTILQSNVPGKSLKHSKEI